MIWMRVIPLDQTVTVGPKTGPPGHSEALRGPQKGLSRPKRALLGSLGVPLRSIKGPKHLIWMRPTQAQCVEVFWTPVGPSRPSPGLKGAQKRAQK